MTKTSNIVISIIEMILVILIGVVTMVHEEIIIIKICDLEKNVRCKIIKRGNLELDRANNNGDYNDDDNDDYILMNTIKETIND